MKHVEFQYAQSLLEVASEKHLQEKLYNLLNKKRYEIESVLKSLNCFFENPSVSLSEKITAIFSLLDLEKEKFLENFFYYIFLNGRFRFLIRIFTSYIKQYEEINNLKRVQIILASEVKEEVLNKLKDKVINKMQNFKVVFDYFLDPSLLGGYKIIIDDLVIDGSLKTKINNFTRF